MKRIDRKADYSPTGIRFDAFKGMRKLMNSILKLSGWKIVGTFPEVEKSVIIAAPHTSYWDGFWGFIALEAVGIPYAILADESLFHFPMSVLMKIIRAVPVNVKGKDAIHGATKVLKDNDNIHIIICPEGQLAPTDRWNPGFYHIARIAEVPVVVAAIDYSRKEISFRGVISDLSDKNEVFRILKEKYSDCTAKYPEKFLLPEKNLKTASNNTL